MSAYGNLNDTELIALLKEGNKQAFAAIFDKYMVCSLPMYIKNYETGKKQRTFK